MNLQAQERVGRNIFLIEALENILLRVAIKAAGHTSHRYNQTLHLSV